jgi:C-terminal processing protease CtpA/Prc
MTLYEPTDVALKDFSDQSYTEAFDSMFEIVRNEYAFNGIEDKAPDWDALYDQVAPMVAEAEQSSDPNAYYLALAEFTNAFKDGHVGLDGGQYANDEFTNATGYGYGLALRELDDGSVIVTYITEGGPAEEAGIQVGDVVTEFNGEPISDAASAVEPFGGPFSTDFAKRYQQFRYLLRTGDETNDASITFKSGTAAAKTVTLSPVEERDSFSATSLFARYDPNALPVEYAVLAQQGIGYVKINSNYDDLNLIVRLFERAMKTFEANQLPGLIIDLRLNSGGSPMGLAGFLTDETIEMGQLEYYSEATGQFEPDGPREEVYPNETQYSFESMVLLVDQSCYSACEIEAYGFSQVPGMVVMGQYPSGGVEAEVARGQFLLPEGFSLQIPTGRFTLPDGSIFLEGVGVQPTIDVPIDAESVLSGEDAVLNAAIEQITGE